MRLQAALPDDDAPPDPLASLRRITHALVEDLDLVISSVTGMGMDGAERGNTCYAAPEWQPFQAHLDASSCMAGSAACWVSKCRRPDGATSISRACSEPVGLWPPAHWHRHRSCVRSRPRSWTAHVPVRECNLPSRKPGQHAIDRVCSVEAIGL
ncbi:hypothetical protein XFF6992_450019 [Xanthomonas citri pv. fuscans]|nr:hypothetical protein XFF6992_450019 [Xanthomonas citri pv. fuscans]SOO34639.1 hypothetical protein XFF6994_4380002 [Xanthomonas citri pv. fuscans]